MQEFFTDQAENNVVKILIIMEEKFLLWKEKQTQVIKNKIDNQQLKGRAGEYILIDDAKGNLYLVVNVVRDLKDYLNFGYLASRLPEKIYEIDPSDFTSGDLSYFALAWGMESYRYRSYLNKEQKKLPKLFLDGHYQKEWINLQLKAIYLTRDLINTPANDMFPGKIAELATQLGKSYSAEVKIIKAEQLAKDFPLVYAVGQGSDHKPLLVELTFGKIGDPKIVLVGKGVCFDSGGLDLKSPNYMLDMKKDMAGAAHALALGQMIMEAQLPFHLKIILPLVENLPSGRAYKPGDILASRLGKTVEVLNTDAEGRLILADALTLASEWEPELIIDFATLTGAATVALGNEISAIFSNSSEIANKIKLCMEEEQEAVWELPLHQPYAKYLRSSFADLANIPEENIGGGAITAALFLENFVKGQWVHLDIFASNKSNKPGHPKGGEAVGLRGLFKFLVNLSKKI